MPMTLMFSSVGCQEACKSLESQWSRIDPRLNHNVDLRRLRRSSVFRQCRSHSTAQTQWMTEGIKIGIGEKVTRSSSHHLPLDQVSGSRPGTRSNSSALSAESTRRLLPRTPNGSASSCRAESLPIKSSALRICFFPKSAS